MVDATIAEQEKAVRPWVGFIEIHSSPMSYGSYSGAGGKQKLSHAVQFMDSVFFKYKNIPKIYYFFEYFLSIAQRSMPTKTELNSHTRVISQSKNIRPPFITGTPE